MGSAARHTPWLALIQLLRPATHCVAGVPFLAANRCVGGRVWSTTD